MKTLIRSIFITSLIVSVASCSDDDVNGATGSSAGGTKVALTDTQISLFDVNSDLSISLESNEGVSITGVEVFDGTGATKQGDATVSGNTATFNSSALTQTAGAFAFPTDEEGVTSPTGSIDIEMVYAISGGNLSSASANGTLDVVNAISFTQEVPALKFNDTATSNVLKYETFTLREDIIDEISVTRRLNKTGAEVPLTGFEIEKDSINFADAAEYAGFAKGDTLNYTFVVRSGVLTDTIKTSVRIVPQPFGGGASGTISSDITRNKLDLSTGGTFIDGDDKGDLVFEAPQGIKATDDTTPNVQFVLLGVTGADEYGKYNDVEQAKIDFDGGAQLTTAQLLKDQIYVYKLTRDIGTEDDPRVVDVYGTFLVGDITVTNPPSTGDLTDIVLLSKENYIAVQPAP